MRTFFVIFITAWLLGISFGVNNLNPALTLSLALAVTIFCRPFSSLPHSTATGVLVLLGFILGLTAPLTAAQIPACTIADPATATIDEPPLIKSNQIQYRATIDNCAVLIIADRFPVYNNGQIIKLSGGKFEYVSDIDPAYRGYADYLVKQGINATWRFADIVADPLTSEFPVSRRQTVLAQIDQLFIEPDASIVAALLLADRGTIPQKLNNQFRATGVSHVLAISGLHLSLLAGALVLITSLLPLPPLLKTAITVTLLWGYLLFITFPTSAVRAGWFWTLALFAFRFHLLANLPTVLALSALVMVTYSPQIITEVGWQLSVSAVTGIFLALFLTRRLSLQLFSLPKAVGSLLIVSLGATLTTWPLIAYYFGTFSALNILANLLVVPVIPFILFSSSAALLLSYLFPAAAILLAWPTHLLIKWLDLITASLAGLSYTFYEGLHIPIFTIPVYYVALILLSSLWLKYQHRTWREIWQ